MTLGEEEDWDEEGREKGVRVYPRQRSPGGGVSSILPGDTGVQVTPPRDG